MPETNLEVEIPRNIGVLFGCFASKLDGPGLPGGLIIYQGNPSISPKRTCPETYGSSELTRGEPSAPHCVTRPPVLGTAIVWHAIMLVFGEYPGIDTYPYGAFLGEPGIDTWLLVKKYGTKKWVGAPILEPILVGIGMFTGGTGF